MEYIGRRIHQLPQTTIVGMNTFKVKRKDPTLYNYLIGLKLSSTVIRIEGDYVYLHNKGQRIMQNQLEGYLILQNILPQQSIVLNINNHIVGISNNEVFFTFQNKDYRLNYISKRDIRYNHKDIVVFAINDKEIRNLYIVY